MGRMCSDCGIAGPIDEKWFECLKFKKKFCPGENLMFDCTYFCPRILEEGEPLSPLEHLLMKEQDLASKHMRGPV